MKTPRVWRAPNSGQARKEDLMDVCEILRGALHGGVYRYAAKVTVHELREDMRRVLMEAVNAIARDRELTVAEVEAELPSPFGAKR